MLDTLSLVVLIVTYFFAALRQTNNDYITTSGGKVITGVVLALNVLTMAVLVWCLAMDFKWVFAFVHRGCCGRRPDQFSDDAAVDIIASDIQMNPARRRV